MSAMAESTEDNNSSFSARKINSTTFAIQEDDAYKEHPLIYVKVHPRAPIIVLSDTGCDEPSEEKKHARFTGLRDYLEHCPVACNEDKPLNPKGDRQYYIISTHCHYDHLGGISQFLAGGATEIIASAAGRHFIESDLESHGLFKYVGKPAPCFQVTYWVSSYARLTYPLSKHDEEASSSTTNPIDLGITFLMTPGHTPDELAWYDDEEMHLYVGDSFYETGEDDMAIQWPADGNMIEWVFSMRKLITFVKFQTAPAAAREGEDDGGWTHTPRRVKVGAGHQTYAGDAMEILERLWDVWWRTVKGMVPVVRTRAVRGKLLFTWRDDDAKSGISFEAPPRLMEDCRIFFEEGGPYGNDVTRFGQ